MSIFHVCIKIISRGKGKSAVASAAYRSGEKLYNEETGITHNFTRKGGVVHTEIMLPENAPKRFLDREVLWNEVQTVERRSDAQLAREVEVALPIELDRTTQIECVRNYITKNFVEKGMIADWALHDKGDGNPHAHILLSVRGIDEKSEWMKKQKTVFANAKDEKGRAIYDPSLPSYDPKRKEETSIYRIPSIGEDGAQKKRVREGKGTELLWEKISIPANDWNDKTKAEEWREAWAVECNKYLDEDKHIDHRSYKRQGLDMEPTVHEGVTARKMEADGKIADRCEVNREIRERNSLRMKIKELAEELTKMIIEKARGIYERLKNIRRNQGNIGQRGGDGESLGSDAGGKREARNGEQAADRTAGRIHRLKRTVRETEQSLDVTNRNIEETNRTIEELKSANRSKEVEINERFERLKARRNARHDGTDAGPDRKSGSTVVRRTTEEREATLRKREASTDDVPGRGRGRSR